MFGWGLTRLMQESPIAVARKLFEATANAAREFKLIRTEASE
jgi:hypothetical protein